ncbi:hypothetical protein [Legionella drancourtii]|uniref:Uncharacterized protein n=1 Tax=Legionella drancourtii LLAP12 TaxID=658187 RepID=G9ESH2_9GAMM|nr:hypothetical protein [Legionella drancourtii]EHL29953.1 hypothetical protein LDG_8246 [Legionella drancourtii LLAP12]
MEMDTGANTRENIVGLEQQLKKLCQEIEAKLHLAEGDDFAHLINEVEQAINAINPVVALASVLMNAY